MPKDPALVVNNEIPVAAATPTAADGPFKYRQHPSVPGGISYTPLLSARHILKKITEIKYNLFSASLATFRLLFYISNTNLQQRAVQFNLCSSSSGK